MENIIEIHKNFEDSLSKRMLEFETRLEASSQISSKLDIQQLCNDYKEFKTSVHSILILLSSQIQSIAMQVDEVDNRDRLHALLFCGIREKEGESLNSAVLQCVHGTMGISDVNTSTISHSHRLGAKDPKKVRPILVYFKDYNIRNLIWHNKKKLKSSPYILREFLTKSRQNIFMLARSHFGIHNCWSQGGNVYVKLPSNDRKRISSTEELEELITKYPGTQTKPSNPSSAKSITTVPPVTRKAHSKNRKQ